MPVRGTGRTHRLSAVAAAAAFAAVPASATAGGTERVSDERTRTTWAYVTSSAYARARPDLRAPIVARLARSTYVGRPEVVLVLARRRSGGEMWARVRLPGFGSPAGWVRGRRLRRGGVRHELVVVDRARRQVRAYVNGRLRFRAPAGVGARGSPTPAGRTYVRERLIPPPGSIYGALALGLGIYTPYRTDWPGGGQVGIHGTNAPALIPGRISNGCVRLRDRDVRRLDRIVGVGTPVWIR
jgi:hypothetical protein